MSGRSSNGSAAGASSTGGAAGPLAPWDDWLERATDRLLDIEQRASTAGSDALRLDVGAAFVCRTAIITRLDRMRAGDASNGPLIDEQGELVAADLSAAATLLDAVLDRVDRLLAAEEAQQAAGARLRTQADGDASAVRKLAEQLGQHVRHAADLTTRLTAVRNDPDGLPAVARELATLRAQLDVLAAERTALINRWSLLPDELRRLRDDEVAVRALVARCRDKVRPLPLAAVPAVASIAEPEPIESLQSMPWPAARAVMAPFVTKVDRVTAALEQVRREHVAALSRRDDLRGLLHAFRDKAGAYGLAESAALEPGFKAAESVLWSAPCDIEQAGGLVDAYTRAVNQEIAARTNPSEATDAPRRSPT
jgi:hypothetical protein